MLAAAGGGLRAAAKRTAFNDLSNTRKLGGAIMDDSAINVKRNEVENVQVAANPTLLRPPMRSAAPVNNSSNYALPATKQAQYNKPTAVPNKRVNTVFKDIENEPLISTNIQAEFPAQGKPSVDFLGQNGNDNDSRAIDGRKVPVQQFHEIVDAEEARKRPVLLCEIDEKEETSNEPFRQYMRAVDGGLTGDIIQRRGASSQQVGVIDPDEVWDGEDEDDEDQDYTTAHSFRSKGDNTTGGVTTVLKPQFTNKIRAELEAARRYVERTLSPREVHDEAWDTSMVMEYGEDIFNYMREQEVSLASILLILHPSLILCHCSNADSSTTHSSSTSLKRTIWTSKARSSGRCVLYLWTGWFRFTVALDYFPRLYSSASTALIASSLSRSCLWVNFNWLVQLLFSLLPSMKRSTARPLLKLSSWLMGATLPMKSSRQSASCY